MRVLLTRHGLTAGNLEQRYVGGKTDEPLSREGIDFLEKLPKKHGVCRVYTSGLVRTVQTAAILYPRAEQAAVPDLREMEFGRFEGKAWHELAEDAAYRQWVDGGCTGRCPGGESRDEFVGRCCRAFLKVLETEQASAAVDFVVHGGTIMALLSALAQPRMAYFSGATPPGGGWMCTWNGDFLRILQAPKGEME